MVSILLVALLPICALGTVLYFSAIASLEQQLLASDAHGFESNQRDLDRLEEEALAFLHRLQSNSVMRRYFNDDRSSLGDILYSYHSFMANQQAWFQITKPETVSQFTIYTRNKIVPKSVTVANMETFPRPERIPVIHECTKSNLAHTERYVDPDTGQVDLAIYSMIVSNEQRMTFVELIYRVKSLPLVPENTHTSYYLFSPYGDLLMAHRAGAPTVTDAELLSLYGGEPCGQIRVDHGGNRYLVSREQTKYLDCLLLSVADERGFFGELTLRRNQFMIGLALSMALVMAIVYWIASQLSGRITWLTYTIERMDASIIETHIRTVGNDEVDYLAQSINALTDRVTALTKREYEVELELKEKELMALQKQLSPHFLYNTIESLSMLAVVNKQQQISDGMTALGRLLRYYTRRGAKLSPLNDEIDSIVDYLGIQNIIHGNAIHLNLELAESLRRYKVPNLSLQPLVENAVKHGYKQRPSDLFSITIAGELADDVLVLRVSNNGAGIEPGRLMEINRLLDENEQDDNNTAGIGVLNVNRQIKLIMGNRYGLRFESDDLCTTITMRLLPLI